MITKKFDKEVAALRNRSADATCFTAQYHDTHANVHITYADDHILYITMGEYSDRRNYAAYYGNGSGNHRAEFATFADLLTYLDGGKAA